MAVTVSLVKKLILEYIGGQKVLGNAKQVIVDGKKIVVQKAGLASSITGSLANIGSVGDIVGSLVSNPIAALTDQVSGLAENLTSSISGLNLAAGLQDQLNDALGQLNVSTNLLKDHTDILSGLVVDPELIPSTKAALSDLTNLTDPDKIQELAGALFKDNEVLGVVKSLNPQVAGGVTDIYNRLESAVAAGAPAQEIEQLTDHLSKSLIDHSNAIQDIVTTDETAFGQFKLERDITETVGSLIPTVQTPVFDRIATDSLKTLVGTPSEDQETTATPVVPTGTLNIQVAVDSTASKSFVIETVTSNAYAYIMADAGKHKRFTNTTNIVCTVPNNNNVAFPVGTRIRNTAAGTGTVIITPEPGVVINSRDDAANSAGQFAVWEIEKVATNEWDALGDLA